LPYYHSEKFRIRNLEMLMMRRRHVLINPGKAMIDYSRY